MHLLPPAFPDWDIWKEVPTWAHEGQNGANRAVSKNDDSIYTPSKKEELLIALFAEHGIALSFTGEHSRVMIENSAREIANAV